MSKFLLLFVLLFAVGCGPGPTLMCDYCHVERPGALRYMCDKCTQHHVACEVEKSIMHYSEAGVIRGRIYYSATSILTCPEPEKK